MSASDLPIAPDLVWIVLSPSGGIVHAQPHEPHPADARMWASRGATVAEYVPKEDARRCDGCHRYECGTAMHGHCPIRGDAPPPDGHCENWEAKR
jgi:hypothetical protein